MKEIGPRYDSKPTQPPDCGAMSSAEADAHFDEMLEREDVAESVWISIYEDLDDNQRLDIIRLLFRRQGHVAHGDFTEAGRLLYKWLHKSVTKIVEDAE